MYFWALDTSVAHCTHHVGVSCATVVQWYQYFHAVCSWKFLRTPIELGGIGNFVQIDESVTVKAKYNRGHQLHDKQWWVFRIYDPQDKVGYIQLVDTS